MRTRRANLESATNHGRRDSNEITHQTGCFMLDHKTHTHRNTHTDTRTQKHAHTAWTHPQTHQRAHMLFGHNRLMEQYVIDVPHLAVVNCVRPPLRGVLNGSDAFIRFELFMQYYTLQCSMQSMFVCNLFHDYHLYSICYFLIISESNMFRWLCT